MEKLSSCFSCTFKARPENAEGPQEHIFTVKLGGDTRGPWLNFYLGNAHEGNKLLEMWSHRSFCKKTRKIRQAEGKFSHKKTEVRDEPTGGGGTGGRSWGSIGIHSGSEKQPRPHNLGSRAKWIARRCLCIQKLLTVSRQWQQSMKPSSGFHGLHRSHADNTGLGCEVYGNNQALGAVKTLQKSKLSPVHFALQKTPPLDNHSETNESCLG